MANHKKFTSQEDIKLLNDVLDQVESGVMSFRQAARHLEYSTGKKVSYETLRKQSKGRTPEKAHRGHTVDDKPKVGPTPKAEDKSQQKAPEKPQVDLEDPQADWNQNPDQYQRDEKGNFLLKKDGYPKKLPGKKKGSPHNFHSKTKAKMAARREARRKKKIADKARRKWEDYNQRYKQQKESLEKLDAAEGNAKRSAVLEDKDIDNLTSQMRGYVEEEANIVFKPNPGPQFDFLASPEDDVLYGGQAGGGKSLAMLADVLRNVSFKEHRGLILRRTLHELRELIDKSRELFPLVYPGAKFKEAEKVWHFPNGCKIEFGYLEKDADVYQYQGQSYSWIGFDELTQLPTEFPWNYLQSRLRTTNPQLNCYMRTTANPGGAGHNWVKARYIDPASPNTRFTVESPDRKFKVSRKFIPAKLSDNPYLYQDGRYEANLALLPEVERRRLLEGDWNIVDGMAFPEFDESLHVIPPMEIPPFWERVKAIDYGYSSPSCVLWGAVDPEDGTLIIYRELYERGLDAQALADRITEMEREEVIVREFHQDIRGVVDGQCFARTGYIGPTQGEILIKSGHKVRPADKNRKGGKVQIHEWLRPSNKGRPKVQIFSTCQNLIREIQGLPLKKNDPEDVDTDAEDHAYDALRYMIMSRPRQQPIRDKLGRIKQQDVYMPADPVVGY